ncbi:hypothetical protein MKW92_020877 [Papaver armeniacum]|nr:hypothetical protein MKW92_020877 [Papaver armeniacum]
MGKFSEKPDYLCLMFNFSSSVAPQVEIAGAYKTVVASYLSNSVNKSELIEFFKQAEEVVDARYRFEHFGWKILDVVEFFKQAGEIVDVRFSLDHNGNLGEIAILSLQRCYEELSFFFLTIGWFRTQFNFPIKQVQSSLVELFSTCGEISWMHIPTFCYTGIPRGIAFMEFFDCRDFHKALAMTLTVKDATPVRLDVQPTGVSMRLRGRRAGSIYPFGYYFPDRGWGGAGIGKDGNI